MKPANERFINAATALGLSPEPRFYPEGTRTAVDAAAAVGCDVGQIVKSLVFMSDHGPVLALTSGANRVDLRALGEVAAGSVRQANADEVREATGFAIGGTPPFGHPESIVTYIDEDLMSWETVWAAAGTPDSCFPIEPAVLRDATRGTVAPFSERRSGG